MARERLRVSNRSVVLTVAIVIASLAVVGIVGASVRVLGWLVVAAVVAGLLHPIAAALGRRIPRALALLVVVLGMLLVVGPLAYGSFEEIQNQADRLQRAAPEAAERLEESRRFGEAAREFQLAERVQTLVDELPERLRGGEAPEAIRAAATRGVAFLATGVLSLFLLIHGPRLLRAGFAQIHDTERRAMLERVLRGAYGRAWRYVVLTLGRATLAGAFTFLVCEVIDVPGALLLAVWVATFSLMPLLGIIAGSLAVLLLSFAVDSSETAAVAALFVAYQAFEAIVLQRRLERRSVHVGPVISLLSAMFGLELYGIGGLLVSLIVAVLAVSFVVELAADQPDLHRAADRLLAGDEPDATDGEAAPGSRPGPPAGATRVPTT